MRGHYSTEIRFLNELKKKVNYRILLDIDFKAGYTNWTNKRYALTVQDEYERTVTIHLNLMLTLEDNEKLLTSVVGHEIVHVRDILNGNMVLWEITHGTDKAEAIVEYKAFSVSAKLKNHLVLILDLQK